MRRGRTFPTPVVALLATLAAPANAQTAIMPIGDSITHGGQTHASYRYELWFDLLADSYVVDFVGGRNFTFDGNPNPAWYPDYYTSFDRDHQAYWGWRTDQVRAIIAAAAAANPPEIALIHLGTNDIGQNGAAGVTSADANLRLIIDDLRSAAPNVTILLAQVIPIGPGTSYFNNAGQVAPLNAAIATIAADKDLPNAPVIVVDQHTGFDLGTMMQADGLHPNTTGEAWMADNWRAALATILTTGNPPPTVSITSPPPGATFTWPAEITIEATASDSNGLVSEVRFYHGDTLIGTDASAPYRIVWSGAPLGSFTLSAEATDDEGAIGTSGPVSISIVPPTGGVALEVMNHSFETPVLADGVTLEAPGTVGNWTFTGIGATYRGIFNPPIGSYPDAGGNAPPAGADGANVAYLFNNGGPGASVETTQPLSAALLPQMAYTLEVAIGRFLPGQPYAFSTYGGYVVQLLAGGTVIAADTGTVDPNFGMFRDAVASVSVAELDPNLVGQPLSIRLTIADNVEDRSTHFDNVRLTRRSLLPGDHDHDGDIDWIDAAQLLDCLSGPGLLPAPTPPTTAGDCLAGFDLDGDADVDLLEVAGVQAGFEP